MQDGDKPQDLVPSQMTTGQTGVEEPLGTRSALPGRYMGLPTSSAGASLLYAPAPPTQAGENEPSLHDVLKLLSTYRRIILLTILTFFGMGLLYSFLATETYTATATIEIGGRAPVLPNSDLELMLGRQAQKTALHHDADRKAQTPFHR